MLSEVLETNVATKPLESAENRVPLEIPLIRATSAQTHNHKYPINNMIKEEQKVEEEQENAQEEPAKTAPAANSFYVNEGTKRVLFIIERSKVYSNFVAEQMLRLSNRTHMTEEAIEQKQKRKEEREAKKTTTSSRKSTRNSASATQSKSNGSTSNSKRSAAGRNIKKNVTLLSQEVDLDVVIKKAQVAQTAKEALEIGAKEEKDSNMEGMTKPTKGTRQPELVTGGTMKDYQLAGLEWLISLYENGLNGILADEMGLGKTLQTISFFAFLRSKQIYGPFLVVAPLSTLSNWINEFERFTPDIPVLMYYGPPPERQQLRTEYLTRTGSDFPVVVTSYEMIMRDRPMLNKLKWKYIVIDEGHRIKNLDCKLVRELSTYQSANRLLLTGTPLQNNLTELWSLLHFLLPDIFALQDLDYFLSWFDFSALHTEGGMDQILDQEHQNKIVSNLHQILKPFLLRRLKCDVELSLPKKREYIIYAPLTPKQVELYESTINHQIRELLTAQMDSRNSPAPSAASSRKRKFEDDTSDTDSLPSSKRPRTQLCYRELNDEEWFTQMEALVNSAPREADTETLNPDTKITTKKRIASLRLQNLLMQLRKVSNHPYLFDWPTVGDTDLLLLDEKLLESSGKMILLDRLLTALLERDHKVLIFSQFTTMLNIIELWAEDLKFWKVCRIDGDIKQEDRRQEIQNFNTDPSIRIFLLSTRAGGLGINLAAADTVIIFDSDWNPQQDIQAQDRAHRIGQTRPVIVYRFISANTVESKILARATAKRRLEKLVIQKGKFQSFIPVKKTEQESFNELSELLKRDDSEKFIVENVKDQILSDAQIDILLDRSDEAYEQALAGKDVVDKRFQVVKEQINDDSLGIKTEKEE
ncbi:Lymphoid-specific helicase [Neolecta irregularis DAH-3]|uniref:Lymphoid-specific helicase n=1 Tax=Neolecta irregularis (strain DAH-3) TaxID=1198029 RepID=A0A1U7LS26_NEOID|nr:Lymphoid-specific helicase [Neolecta irregularis DAH-3]|eukprot:OLL25321.1 Lymphoid-specific helicase [Neolecta irregularis DAH-3]